MASSVFSNQVVVVTGASSGIGRALAVQLARQGARLALAARNEDCLEEVAAECRSAGGQALVVRTDVTDPRECCDLIERAMAEFGRIDMLVNNAGVSMWSRFEDVKDLSIFEKMVQVNYLGSLYCTYFALPYLKQVRGQIVAVSSLAGKTGVPKRSGYAASKHAMVGFFESLRVELRGSGVSVTVVSPGFVATGGQSRGFGPDGRPFGRVPLVTDQVMPVEECARIILEAAAKRKREEVMTLRGKLGQWLKLIAPGLVDRIAQKAIEEGK